MLWLLVPIIIFFVTFYVVDVPWAPPSYAMIGVAVGGLVLAGALWWRRRDEVGRPGPSASLRADQSAGQRPQPAPDEPTVPDRGSVSSFGGDS